MAFRETKVKSRNVEVTWDKKSLGRNNIWSKRSEVEITSTKLSQGQNDLETDSRNYTDTNCPKVEMT